MNKQNINSQQAWLEKAREVLPGGGLGNLEPSIFVSRGKGSNIWDENGRKYVDYLIGSGPMVLGHGNPEVLEVVHEQIDKGLTFFENNALAVELAEEIIRSLKCAEQLRYLCTGTEADMYAIRAARAYTGREKLLKFEGGYHGMSAEAQMSLAPKKSKVFPDPIPDSAGIPKSVEHDVLVAPFNDLNAVREMIEKHPSQIAAIIVEPFQRIIPPADGFLQGLSDLCNMHGIILIFDEIVTGYRLSYGGAQEFYGVTPDLCTLGKIIGGGFALAAVAGKKAILDHFDKAMVGDDKWLMQIGTLSGNPVASAAGLKTMEILRRPGTYERFVELGNIIQDMIRESLDPTGVPYKISGEPALFEVLFTEREIVNYRDFLTNDASRYNLFNKVLREHGVFKPPGKIYVSLTLTDDDLEVTRKAIQAAAKAVEAAK